MLNCLACDSRNLRSYINLGDQPPANSFLDKIGEQVAYPLGLQVCKNCFHTQIEKSVSPNLLYQHYVYLSGTAKDHTIHFEDMVNDYRYVENVLEIGSNNGALLKLFKSQGCNVLGVDPAENLEYLSKVNGVPTLVDYWGGCTWAKVDFQPRLVLGLNCFAHNPNPFDFLMGVRRVLANDGIVLLEFPLWSNSLRILDLGQVYHEHINYFTANSFMHLVERAGFYIEDLTEFPDLHGGTVRFILKKGNNRHSSKLTTLILREEVEGAYDKYTYSRFNTKIWNHLINLVDRIGSRDVVAYGASAKSSTILNFCNSLAEKVKYIVDDSPIKCNKFSPGNNIPIYSTGRLEEEKNPLILVLAHNWRKNIKERLQAQGIKGQLLHMTPDIEVENI